MSRMTMPPAAGETVCPWCHHDLAVTPPVRLAPADVVLCDTCLHELPLGFSHLASPEVYEAEGEPRRRRRWIPSARPSRSPAGAGRRRAS